MTKFEFHFDFGSPNAYLSHLILPSIAERTGVSIDYVPVLLGGVFNATNNMSPMISLQGIRNKGEYASLETERFVKKHSITDFSFNSHFPINTLQIMRGAIAAQVEGVFEPYVSIAYRAMWADGEKMDDPTVIVETLNRGGLDGEKIMVKSQDPDVKKRLIDNTNASVERGTFGSPTFFAGDEMYFGKDQLRDFEEMIETQK